jgi:hypothetical protein
MEGRSLDDIDQQGDGIGRKQGRGDDERRPRRSPKATRPRC